MSFTREFAQWWRRRQRGHHSKMQVRLIPSTKDLLLVVLKLI